jgi:hypothetical protein
MSQAEILLVPIVDNTDGWTRAPIGHGSRVRSVYLRFEPVPENGTGSYKVTALGDEMRKYLPMGGGQPEGTLTVRRDILVSAITEVQQMWQQHVVQHLDPKPGGTHWFPFAEKPDLSDDPRADARLREVARPLAAAGYRLYRLLFCSGDEVMKEIGSALEKILSIRGQLISVQSDSLFAPWWLLYTPPPGFENFEDDSASPVPWEGFWGYSHLVEHNFKYSPQWKPCINIDATGIIAGLNVDRDLDEEFPEAPSIKPVIEMFESINIASITRETKSALRKDIRSSDYDDDIIYFGCHGTGVSAATGAAQALVRLTDKEPIRSTDFTDWLAQSPLHTNPLIFINACKAGQMSAIYTSIGRVLMDSGANCLVGAQVDIPPSFAAAYARDFFPLVTAPSMAVSGSEEPVRVGDVFQNLAQTGIIQRKNPLGLVMSLYRGLDSHFCCTQDYPS